MTTDPRIPQLVASWQAHHLAGHLVTPEEVCGDCPELTEELKRHLAKLSLSESPLAETAFETPSLRAMEAAAQAPTAVSSLPQATGLHVPANAEPPPTIDSKTLASISDTSAGQARAAESIGEEPAILSPLPTGAPSPSDHLNLPGYEVLGELGRGGMGVVYKARQVGLNRLVAIKMILSGANAGPRERARFHSEAESVARLQHPNIVQIYDISQKAGCPWFSLEFVDGDSLYKRVGGRSIDPYEAAVIMESLALAIDYAHERGVIHRDLKPANILLSGGDGKTLSTSTPKITDFGLARQLEQDVRLTQSGVVIGTPCYMAPEQVENPGGDLGPSVDIYGLGALLYELLTGRPPFCAETNFETMRQVVSEDPVPPSKLNPAVPLGLEKICLKCLEKETFDRYPTARALAEDLILFLDGKRPTAQNKRPSGIRRRPESAGLRRSGGREQPKSAFNRTVAAVALLVLLFAAMIAFGVWHYRSDQKLAMPALPVFKEPPIKVGILHSLSGTMAISETAVVEATQMAINEINEQGGLLGREVVPIIRDGQSDAQVFFKQAEDLIKNEHVCTVFGVWTSSTRKTILPVFETNNHLLVYPVSNEGLEDSPNILYVGAAPNQQLIPAVKWAYAALDKRRFFLVGSDYIFPHAANAIIKDELQILVGGRVVGEAYIPLGSADVQSVIKQIEIAQPDVIINTINGDSNIAFFRALRGAGISSADVPVMSTSIGEQELRTLGISNLVGDYAAQNYFQSVEGVENDQFLERLHQKYGSQRVATDAMEAAYSGVHLWAKAVTAAGTDDVNKIREALPGLSWRAPSGLIMIDPQRLNTHRIARIGQVGEDGQFNIVNSSNKPVTPIVYPKSRTPAEWQAFLDDLYHKWGNKWIHNPPQN